MPDLRQLEELLLRRPPLGEGAPQALVLRERPRHAGGVDREVDCPPGLDPEHQIAKQLRRQDGRQLSGGGADPLRRAHLGAREGEELVAERDRHIAPEDFPRQRGRDLVRPAGAHVVLAAAFQRHVEHLPLGRPLELPGELAVAPEGAPAPSRAAPLSPLDEIGSTLVCDSLAVVVARVGRANSAASLADGLERQPIRRPDAARLAPVDVPHLRGGSKVGVDRLVEPARPVDVAHEVEVGVHPQGTERGGELAEVRPGHALARQSGRRRRPEQGRAQELPEVLAGAVGYLIDRIHVVASVDEPGVHPAPAGRPGEGVMDENAPQRTDMGQAARRLRVVYHHPRRAPVEDRVNPGQWHLAGILHAARRAEGNSSPAGRGAIAGTAAAGTAAAGTAAAKGDGAS